MNTQTGMPEVDAGIPENAVSVYGQTDAMDDFPVLKAFQQYIDAEQAKARKRLMILCAFFAALMVIVVAVFVGLLLSVSSRNDRLVEYVIRDRERPSVQTAQNPLPSPTIVQQDSSAVAALSSKLDELQKKLAESQAKAEQMAAEASAQAKQAALDAVAPKKPTAEELEIERLKALLSMEKEKRAAEQEKRRQEELEAYRRKHYPELYEKPRRKVRPAVSEESVPRKVKTSAHDELLDEVDRILEEDDGDKPVRYFDEEEEDVEEEPVTPSRRTTPASKNEYSIPVEIQGSSSRWNIPGE